MPCVLKGYLMTLDFGKNVRGWGMLACCTGALLSLTSALSLAQPAAEKASESAEPDYSSELPRIPSRSVEESLKAFDLVKGFGIQCVASEPLVASPVATCFDADSHLFIAEMRDYSEQETEKLGRIRRLVDKDQDGVFDSATVFAEGLSWPTAVIAYDGGVFVGAAPDIWYFKDHDGDGVADEKRIVLTGFGRTNVQGLLNSFRWGFDNRIHGATSVSGGQVKRPEDKDSKGVDLRGRDFSFDPRLLDIRAETGGGQHGMCFDDWGLKYVCSNSRHAQFVAYEERYLTRNPHLPAPDAKIDIAIDGGQATVYRSSPVEPWRIVRTRLRVTKQVIGAVEGGGRAAGYFTGATGITIFRGDSLGDEMKGLAIVGDVGSNIVHRKKLTPDGIGFRAERIDDQTEFVRSSENWFRPVQFANTPDGCLHILDIYREVVEHPKSIPESIKKHLDLTNGRDQGRIYRVVPEGYKYRPTPQFSQMSGAQLVEMLSHPNAWHRETACRLIYERQDKSLIPALRRLAVSGAEPLGRFHALAAVQGLNGLDSATVIAALKDSHPRIRERAVRLAEGFVETPGIVAALQERVNDDDLRVRYQLAFTAGEFPLQQREEWLAEILKRDGGDTWVQLAALSSLSNGAENVLVRLLADHQFLKTSAAAAVLPRLVRLTSQTATPEKIVELINHLDKIPDSEVALQNQLLMSVLRSSGKVNTRQLIEKIRPGYLDALFASSRERLSGKATVAQKIAAVELLTLSANEQDVDLLISLLTPTADLKLQTTTLTALKSFRSPVVAEELLKRWPDLSPAIRSTAEEVLFARPEWIAVTLTKLENQELPVGTFSNSRLQAVANGANADLKKRAQALQKLAGTSSRSEIVKQYSKVLTMPGDAGKGREIFQRECSGCHRLAGMGFETGPNLAAMKNRGREAILLNVLDPNREVNPEYLNYIVVMEDGRALTGMIRSESATSLNLQRANQQSDLVLRSEIDEIRNSGLSLMPEGLEKQLDPESMAHLLEFLMTVGD